MNNLTRKELPTGSLISSPPPPRRMTMHMHPPRDFNIQYSNIYDLKLTSQTLYHFNKVKAPTTFVGCLTSQQHASVSQGRICSDNFTCCHTEIEIADQTFTHSQYTDTGSTSPSPNPIMPGAWQDSHWSANFESHWYDSTPKKSRRKRDSNPGSSALNGCLDH